MLDESSQALRAACAAWDGRSTAELARLDEQHRGDDGWMADVLALLASPDHAGGASWLLKRALERGDRLGVEEMVQLVAALPGLETWDARLHVLQCLASLRFASDQRAVAEVFVRRGLDDSKKFVRAWAYHGLAALARQFPDLQGEARRRLEGAMEDEAPSVRARVRNLLKQGF